MDMVRSGRTRAFRRCVACYGLVENSPELMKDMQAAADCSVAETSRVRLLLTFNSILMGDATLTPLASFCAI